MRRSNLEGAAQLSATPPMSVTLEAFAAPIIESMGTNSLSHTFVYARDAANGTYNCTCYGDVRVPTATDTTVVPSFAFGNMQVASCMINMSAALLPVYNNRRTDTCGLTYAINGVCHMMTNRILLAAGSLPMPLIDSVKGYGMSSMIYGFYGMGERQTHTRVAARLMAAITTATMALGSSKDKEVVIFDPNIFAQYCSRLEKQICDLKDNTMKCLLKMELLGCSTPATRLTVLYQQRILGGSSEQLRDDERLKSLIRLVDNFLANKESLLAEYNDDEKVTQQKEWVGRLSEYFVNMNRDMYNILGEDDYKRLFGNTFDRDFTLYVDEYLL